MKKDNIYMKILFPFIALFSMLMGSQITGIFSLLSQVNNRIDCQLLVIVLLTAYFYFDKSFYLLTVAAGIGMLFDIYFYELVGIYTICLPVMIIIFDKMVKITKTSLVNYFMFFVLCHLFIMYSSYFIKIIFGIVIPDFDPFIVLYVAPSLVLNSIIDLIFIFYGERYYLKFAKILQMNQ